MKEKKQSVFLLLLAVLFSVCAAAQEWQEFESLGYDRHDHPFVKVAKEGKQYYYHLDGRLLVDEIENKGFGMSVVMKDGAYGVVAEDGKLLAPFAYDGIKLEYDYTGQWYEGIPYNYKFISLQKDGLYGVADSNGNILSAPSYDAVRPINKQIIAVAENNRWGWIDARSGELLQPCIYEEVEKTYAFENHIKVGKDGRFGVAKKDGTIVIPIESENYLYFLQTAGGNYIITEKRGEYTVYDSLGKIRLQGDYPSIKGSPYNNMFTYRKNSLNGVLNPNSGKVVFEPQFSTIRDAVRGLYIVETDKKQGVVTEDGKRLLPLEYDRIEFINSVGNVRNQDQHIDLSFSSNAYNQRTPEQEARIRYEAKMDSLTYYIKVFQAGKIGIVDWEGKVIIPLGDYQTIMPQYSDGLYFFVRVADGKIGILDATGKELLAPRYHYSNSYQYNIGRLDAYPELTKRYVLLENDSQKPEYQEAIGLFDLKTEKMVIEPATQSIEWMSKDLFKVIPRGEDHQPVRIYDAEGKMLSTLDSNTLDVFLLNNGLLLAEKKEGYNNATMLLMDISGKVLYENPKWTSRGSYGNIRFPENEQWVNGYFYGGWKKIYADETNLFVNERGEEKRFADYDQVDGFFAGHALVAKKMTIEDEDAFRFGGDYYHFGLIDSTGQEVFPPEWQSVTELGKNPYLLVVRKKGKYGLIDRRGKVILEPVYDYMESSTSEPYVQLQKNDKFGLMTAEGRIVIEPRYDRMWESGEGKEKTWPLFVKDGEWYYFVGKDGKPYPIRAKQRD